MLLARPLVLALRATFPDAEIAGVGPGPLVDLLATDGSLDQRHAWPSEGGRAGLAHRIRSWGPDVACVLPPSFSSALWSWHTGARVRVGYRHEARDLLLTHRLKRPPRGDRHLSDEYLEIGRIVGASPAPFRLLPPSDDGLALADRRLASLGLARGGFAVIGPAAIYGPAKRWPADRFAAIGRTLGEAGLVSLVCGTNAEREACDEVARAIGSAAHSLAGDTGLPELAGLCARAGLAVCNDSGLAHLAAQLGCRTVVVFGSTSSAWTAPLGPAVRVVQRAPVCSPCFQRTCAIGTVCLTGIPPHRVASACRELMERAA